MCPFLSVRFLALSRTILKAGAGKAGDTTDNADTEAGVNIGSSVGQVDGDHEDVAEESSEQTDAAADGTIASVDRLEAQ